MNRIKLADFIKIASVIVVLLILGFTAASLTGCRASDRVSYNVSREADDFKVCRRITVINSRTDTVIYQLEGIFSLSNGMHNELEIIVQTGEDEYKKHFVYLTDTVLYVVEDMQGSDVSPYHYKVIFYPETIGGVDVEIR